MIDFATTVVILLGDFNATSPAWLSSDNHYSAGRVLEPMSLQLGLQQFVTFPTRLRNDGGCGSCIDLVFCSSPGLVKTLSPVSPLGNSDHVMVDCVFHVQPAVGQMGSRLLGIWIYDKAEFVRLKKSLSDADWSEVYTAPDIDLAWAAWKKNFL